MATTSTSKPRRRAPRRPAPPRPPSPPEGPTTIGELLKRLGNIPASRVLLHPTPGTATEKDVLKILDGNKRLCELVEGTLVEKAMGYEESQIAVTIILPLGTVTGEAGTIKLFAGLVLTPDVAFISWDRLPGRKRPKEPIPLLAPDLVVEVLSKSNTRAEMKRKLGEYFGAGVLLVWLVDPR